MSVSWLPTDNTPIRVFIASATEGLDVAYAIRDALKGYDGFEPKVWKEDIFKESLTFIESLEDELDKCDFAIVTLTRDDETKSRGKVHMEPRDNVIFELGLFMGRLGNRGRLGRERTYFVFNKTHDPKIPTDLLGVVDSGFEQREGQDLTEAVAEATASLVARMKEFGVRDKIPIRDESETRDRRDFSRGIAGHWWELVVKDKAIEGLSFFSIIPELSATTVRMKGHLTGPAGNKIADWNSVAVGMRPNESSLFYSWQGSHDYDTDYQGFGQFRFHDRKASNQPYLSGTGHFATLHGLTDPTSWKKVELRRIVNDPERIRNIIENGGDGARKLVMDEALKSFNSDSGIP